MIYFTQLPKHTYPIITTSTSHIIGKLRLNQQILFALSKITNNWLVEEELLPFYFIFKSLLFFICRTKQNSKEVIWLRTFYLVITTWCTLKWYGTPMFVKQPTSINKIFAPKLFVKVFCPAYWLIPLSQ